MNNIINFKTTSAIEIRNGDIILQRSLFKLERFVKGMTNIIVCDNFNA
jgi:hypothetical protein